MDFTAPQSAPADPVLAAVFATVQLEQRALARRYTAVVQLRMAAQAMRAEGLFPAVAIDGDRLVLEVAVPGLGGIEAPVAADVLAPVLAELPSFLRAQVLPEVSASSMTEDQDGPDAEWIDPAVIGWANRRETEVVSPLGGGIVLDDPLPVAAIVASDYLPAIGEFSSAEQKSEPKSESAKAPLKPFAFDNPRGAIWTADEDAQLVTLMADRMRAGMHKTGALRAAAKAINRSTRAIEARLRRGLIDDLNADLAANPVPEKINAASALGETRGNHLREARWSGADDTALIEGVLRHMADGKAKLAAIHAAAAALDRSPRAGEARIFNALAGRFAAELKADAEASANARQKKRSLPLEGWSEAEDATLVRIVADAICAGRQKRDGVAAAAEVLDRGFHGCMFRVLNKAKDALVAELSARAGVAKAQVAPVAPPASVAAPAGSAAAPALPSGVAVGDGGGSSSPAPVAPPVAPPVAAPVAAPVVAVAPVMSKTTVDPLPEPIAQPTPAAVVKVSPPGPRPEGRETQVAPPDDLAPVIAHLRGLSKGNAAQLKRDFAIIHLACANWDMGAIAADLGMDTKAVKQRFQDLIGFDATTKKSRFIRSHIYAGLEAMLTPKAVVA